MAVGHGPDATALSDEFSRRLASTRARSDPRVIGVEHEYVVRRAGAQVDFSREIGSLPITGAALHPTNPYVYLLPSGAAVMADGKVAEVATPPIRAGPGATRELELRARITADELASMVGTERTISGGSTHISVRVEPTTANRLALLHARTLAAPTMLMMDRADSPGLLVRPRPGRLELCGEYVTGGSLRAAAAFALATTVALERTLADPAALSLPLLDVVLEPGRRRFGWYVDRAAFGTDLYAEGRHAALRLVDGTTVRAGDYLRAAWRFAEREARELLSPEEFHLVDDVVEGRRPLPREGGVPGSTNGSHPAPSAHGRCVALRRRGDLRIVPVSATWDWMAFEVTSNGDRAVALVARPDLDRFADALDAGALDDLLVAYLDLADGRRELRAHAQTGESGLHDSISPGPAILPNDAYGIGAGRADPRRPGKRLPPSEEAVPGAKGNTAIALMGAFLAVVALSLALITRGSTTMAGVPDEQDPRSVITGLDGVVDDGGELWIRVQLAQGWVDGPPRDLFSVFLAFVIPTFQEELFGYEWHDSVETVVPPPGRDAGGAFILADGSLLLATGVSPGDEEFVQVFYRSGSWVDELTSEPVSGSSDSTLEASDLALGDPLTVFGEPVFDLTTGSEITPSPPTTLPPTTLPPTTIATAAPTTTGVPTTIATAAPTTIATAAPTTIATAAPTTTVVPTTTAPAAAPEETPPPTTEATPVTPDTTPGLLPPDGDGDGDGGRNPVWLFLVALGLLLLGGGWFILSQLTGTAPPPTGPEPIALAPPPLFEKGNDDRRTRTRVMR